MSGNNALVQLESHWSSTYPVPATLRADIKLRERIKLTKF